MPLFKEEKYKVGADVHKIRYNVDGNGKFWCAIKLDMQQATGLSDTEYGDTYLELESRVREAVYKWVNQETVLTYHIMYRLCLSSSVKKKLPPAIMDREDIDMRKKTSRIGGEYHPDDQTCMIFDWRPVLRKTIGSVVTQVKLTPVTDQSYHMTRILEALDKGETPHSFHTGHMYKPFEKQGDDMLFESGDTYWSDNDSYKFEIPLTLESWKFFSEVDNTLLKLFAGMLGFLSVEPEKLMSNINKAVESGNMNLLT